jgi:cell division protease FtsH
MVMDFGMSRMGRVTFRESGRSPFLPGSPEMPRERYHSEETAREIDKEIDRILGEAMERVRHILETRKEALAAIANCLIEKEVVDMEELKQLMEANSPNPLIVPGTAVAPKRPSAAKAEPAAAESPNAPGEAAG